MKGTSSYLGRALRVLGVAAVLVAAPGLARGARAQQARIQASAYVLGPVQSYGLRTDTARVQAPDVQRLRIAGVGALEVATGPGAVTRFNTTADRPVRVEIDYVGN